MQVTLTEKQQKFADKISSFTGVPITQEFIEAAVMEQQAKAANGKQKAQGAKTKLKGLFSHHE